MSTTRSTASGTHFKTVSTTGTADVPTATTDGIALQDLSAIRFKVSADQGATLSGAGTIEFYILEPSIGKDQASGTITFSGLPTAGEVLTIAGVTFTASAGAPAAAGEFRTVTDATTVGDNLVTAFNSYAYTSDALKGLTLTNALGVVTVSCNAGGQYDGADGNAVALTETMTNTAVSGATLSGGADARWAFIPELTVDLSALAGVSGKRVIGLADYEVLVPRGARLEARPNGVTVSAGGVTMHHLGQIPGAVYATNAPIP